MIESRFSMNSVSPRYQKTVEGSLSVTALTLIFFFTAIISGGIFFGLNAIQAIDAQTPPVEEIGVADRAVHALISALKSDSTPGIDGPSTMPRSIAVTVSESIDTELEISMSDISSQLNPNAARRWLFEDTNLSMLMSADSSADEIQQLRFDQGPTLEIEQQYGELLEIKEHSDLFTGYGLFNIQTTDEFVLEWIVRCRSKSDSASRRFRLRLQDLLSQRIFIQADRLALLINDHPDIWPLITTASQWNVHFLPEDILTAVIGYEPFGIQDPGTVVNELLERRTQGEIDEVALNQILSVDDSHRLRRFLGTETWFWQVRIKVREVIAHYVILVTPNEPPFSEKRNYLIIERYFDYNGVNL